MISMNLFLIFPHVLASYWIKSRRRRTHYFPLYSVVSHTFGPPTLHMRFDKFPAEGRAIFKIYEELLSTLIEMQKLGYQRVKFVSHLFRKGGTRKFLDFMNANQMSCVHFSIKPTPWIHYVTNKVALRLYKKRKMKVSADSIYITIDLHPQARSPS